MFLFSSSKPTKEYKEYSGITYVKQPMFNLVTPHKISLEPVNYDKVMFSKYTNKEHTTLVPYNTFIENFDKCSNNMFLCVDWNNMIVAGGSILALATNKTIKDSDFSDFDIFFYGLSPRECNKKLIELHNSIKQVYNDVMLIRTSRTITFCFGAGKRYIQVITCVYDSIETIINNFDVDCCCVAFDGSQLWTIERGYKAIMRKANTFNLYQGSYSYEYRLAKYGYRGYVVEYEYDQNRIDNNIFYENNKKLTGLAKLISLEKIPDNKKYNIFCDVIDYHQATMRRNLNASNQFNYSESGYSTKFMPDWTSNKDNASIKAECQKVKSNHMMFMFGSVNELLLGVKPVILPSDMPDMTKSLIINGPVCWTDSNPFSKKEDINFDEWRDTAYNENPKLEQIFNAIKNHRNVELNNLCTDVDLNVRNVVNHTPIHEAIITNNMEGLEILCKHGAKLDFVSKLKKTPIHIATESNNLEAVKFILTKIPDAINCTDSYLCTPLIYSIIYGRTEIFKYLYVLNPIAPIVWKHKHASELYYGLQLCLYYERYDIAKFLLDSGYDINDYDTNTHILSKCIDRHNIVFLKLLYGHENSYKLLGNSSNIDTCLGNIIEHIKYAVFKLSYAFFVTEYIKLNSKCEHMLKNLFVYIVTNMSEEDLASYLSYYETFLTKKFKIDFVRETITSLISQHEEKSIKSTSTNYKIQFAETANEIYVPPKWIIEMETKNAIKVQQNVTFDATKYNEYKNKKILLAKYFLQLMPSMSQSGVVLNIKHLNIESPSDNEAESEPTKKSCIEENESESESESESDSDDEKPPPVQKTSKVTKSTPVLAKKSEVTKSTLVSAPVKISQNCVTINIGTSIKPDSKYFKLFDAIYSGRIISNEELETYDLTCKLSNSGTSLVSVIDSKNENKNLYTNVVNLILTKNEKYDVVRFVKDTNNLLDVLFQDVLDKSVKITPEICMNIIIELLKKNITHNSFVSYFNIVINKLQNGIDDILSSNALTLLSNAFSNDKYETFTYFCGLVKHTVLTACLKYLTSSNPHFTQNCRYVDALISNLPQKNYLYTVANTNNFVFRYLLEQNNVFKLNTTNALHVACSANCLENVVNIVTKYPSIVNMKDERGYTSLMLSIKNHNSKIFEYLMTHGASQTDIDNYGNTPLHLTILHTFVAGVSQLIPHNIENNFRMTPQDYINNMMRSYFYHARNNKTYKQQLGYVTSVYNKFNSSGCERVVTNIANVNGTINDILDRINSGEEMSTLI